MRKRSAGDGRWRYVGFCSALVLLTALLVAPSASATNRFRIDPNPASPGNVIVDGAGAAYIAWTNDSGGSGTEIAKFCKVPAGGGCSAPLSLPIPGAASLVDGVSGAFPVFGGGSTVYVVGPRYVRNDVVVWTSVDGGQSFDGGTIRPGGYSSKTDPSNVLLSGPDFLISAHNAGLGFSSTPAAGGAGGNFSFADPGGGGVVTSSMALDGAGNPVEAYWNFSDPYKVFFYRYSGVGPRTAESSWVGPVPVTDGYESKLAGGSSGLFLVSQDYRGGGSNPTAITVRKFDGTTFTSPTVLANDAQVNLFAGGAIAQSPGGRLAVAWPDFTSPGGPSMRLFTSTNGGASFSTRVVAKIGDAYAIQDNAQLAVGDGGQGWLTFIDSAGLKVADLSALQSPVYNGPTKTISTAVGSNLLFLKLPKRCLGRAQPFYVGVGKKARRRIARSLRSKIKVRKVTFFFDGKKLKRLKRKPYRYLIRPGFLAAGSTHVVKSRVVAVVRKNGKKRKVSRTLKGRIRIC